MMMMKTTRNAQFCCIDVDVQPAESQHVVPCDNQGKPLRIESVGYGGLLPEDGMPSSVAIEREGKPILYMHHTLPRLNEEAHRKTVTGLREDNKYLINLLNELEAEPALRYSHESLVKVAVAICQGLDQFKQRITSKIRAFRL